MRDIANKNVLLCIVIELWEMAGYTCAKKPGSWFSLVALILTLSTFKWTLSKYEVKVIAEGKSWLDKIVCNRCNLQLQITSVKVLVSQLRINSIVCRVKHKRFFKRRINYYSKHDASYQLELLILSCGDVHLNPGYNHQPRAPGNNNNNPPLRNQESARKLSVFYANARNIVNKITKLQMEIASNSFDIIVLTETHLDSSINDVEIFGKEYCVYRRDRQQGGRFGGGVLIATKSCFKVFPRDNLACESELLFIDIIIAGNKKIVMGVLYRPPNSNLKVLEDLQNSLSNIQTNDTILLGDFNLSEIDWANNRLLKTSEHHELLIDIVQDNFLHQLVNEPTRDKNLLDLVLTTNYDMVNNLTVGEPFSDHNAITFTIDSAPYTSRISKKYTYAFNKADWSHLKSLFKHSPWDFVLAGDDINNNCSMWKDLFFAAVNDCIPKYKQKRKTTAPWKTKTSSNFAEKKGTCIKRQKSLKGRKHGPPIES